MHSQLGFSRLQQPFFPKPVLISHFDSTQVVGIACGDKHSLILNKVGQVFSLGCNQHGVLGIEYHNYHNNDCFETPQQLEFIHNQRTGSRVDLDQKENDEAKFLSNSITIREISSNWLHNLAIDGRCECDACHLIFPILDHIKLTIPNQYIKSNK